MFTVALLLTNYNRTFSWCNTGRILIATSNIISKDNYYVPLKTYDPDFLRKMCAHVQNDEKETQENITNG